MAEDKSGLYILGIVGIVAIVGILIMTISGPTVSTSSTSQEDSIGQAIARAGAIDKETKTTKTGTEIAPITPPEKTRQVCCGAQDIGTCDNAIYGSCWSAGNKCTNGQRLHYEDVGVKCKS